MWGCGDHSEKLWVLCPWECPRPGWVCLVLFSLGELVAPCGSLKAQYSKGGVPAPS